TTRWLMYLLILAVLVAGLFFYSWIFKYLIVAVIFTYIINPWISWLERHYVPRLLGIIIVYLGMGILIAWGVIRVLPVLIEQSQSLLEFIKAASAQGEVSLLQIPLFQTIQQQVKYLDSQVPILMLHDQFINLIKLLNKTMMDIPSLFVRNYEIIIEAVSVVAMIPLIGFFLLKDNIKFRKDILSAIPNRYFEIVIILLQKVDDVVGRYLRAMFYEIIIVGTLSSIVLTLLGVDYAILIGFLAGFANVIPYFGPFMGGLFAVTSVLLTGHPQIMILYVIIGMYLVQVIDNNIVYPVVIGTNIQMHPLLVLLTVLAGGWAYGLIGMLVSVPIVYLVYSVTRVLYISLRDFKMI
ncbi:MAG: AI-2E family transporter, partial [Candidatus Cloacimonadaceae bacterium]